MFGENGRTLHWRLLETAEASGRRAEECLRHAVAGHTVAHCPRRIPQISSCTLCAHTGRAPFREMSAAGYHRGNARPLPEDSADARAEPVWGNAFASKDSTLFGQIARALSAERLAIEVASMRFSEEGLHHDPIGGMLWSRVGARKCLHHAGIGGMAAHCLRPIRRICSCTLGARDGPWLPREMSAP